VVQGNVRPQAEMRNEAKLSSRLDKNSPCGRPENLSRTKKRACWRPIDQPRRRQLIETHNQIGASEMSSTLGNLGEGCGCQ
jgi:hypothetical protein